MRFARHLVLLVLVFILQLLVIGYDTWQLFHFGEHSKILMLLNCFVVPMCGYNAWRMVQLIREFLKMERDHRTRMRELDIQHQMLLDLTTEHARWFLQEREAILAHILRIEKDHPEHAAFLRRRLMEAERSIYDSYRA